MSEESQNKNSVFLEKGTWWHTTRQLKKNGKISYGKQGGFATEEEAKNSLQKWEEQFRLEQLTKVYLSQDSSEMLFKDYLDYWMYEIYFERVKDSTKNLTHYVLHNWVYIFLDKDVKMRFLSTEFLDELLKKASKLTSSSANTVRTILFIALNDAVADGVISKNPIAFTKKYPRKGARVRILTKTQLKRFLQEAKQSTWYLEILLCLFCGLRKGEVLGLKFSDIDFNEEILYINRQLNYAPRNEKGILGERVYSYKEVEPKTENSYRAMRIPSIVVIELKNRKKLIEEEKSICATYQDNDYVCCQADGAPRGYTSLNAEVCHICANSGVPKISVHSMRHMYATLLLEGGVSPAIISSLLGHKSLKTTLEYYCEIMEGDKQVIDYINIHFPIEEAVWHV